MQDSNGENGWCDYVFWYRDGDDDIFFDSSWHYCTPDGAEKFHPYTIAGIVLGCAMGLVAIACIIGIFCR